MKIGLPFLAQLRGVPPSDPTPAPTPDTRPDGTAPPLTTDAEGRRNTTGGWTALSLLQMVAGILTGYHTEHNDDDTHKTITATGSISERGRSTPQGDWIAVSYAASLFSASTGSTWTVPASAYTTYAYTLVGRTMTISFQMTAAIVSVAAAAILKLALPAHALVSRRSVGTFAYTDNGTAGVGVVQADPGLGNYLVLSKNLDASVTFSVSGAMTVAGQISVEIENTL